MKVLLKIVGLLVLVLGVLIGMAIYYLDSGIEKAVETYGPRYTQTPVELASATLLPWSGKGSMRGLVVANPDGYNTPNAFTLGEISFSVNTSTLTGNPVLINSLRIVAPEITLEQGSNGSNLQQLQRNVEKTIGAGTRPDAGASASTGKKLVIKDLLISAGQLHYSNPLLGAQTLNVALPDIRLTDIGKKSNGATGAEVVEQILAAINKRGLAAVAEAGALQAVGEQVEKRLRDEKTKIEESLGGFKELLGK